MFSDQKRYGRDPDVVTRAADATFRFPMSKKVKAGDRVFTCSWSDWFHEDADVWRDEAWAIIEARGIIEKSHVDFQILTKRPENIAGRLPTNWGDGWPNVWLGVSVEDQVTAEARIPLLLATPAAVRFVSYEPALGPVDFTRMDATSDTDPGYSALYCGQEDEGDLRTSLDWVICGGESGPKARPMHPDWALSVRDQCQAAGVPFFFKQWGEWASLRWQHEYQKHGDIWLWDNGESVEIMDSEMPSNMYGVALMRRARKYKAGAMLDGLEHREFPRRPSV